MPNWGLILTLLITTSCGGFKLFSYQGLQKERQIASIAVERLINEENQTFSDEIEHKLNSLYSYQAIAQKNLSHFDNSLNELSLEEIYQNDYYLKLLALKSQIDEIESEILETLTQLEGKKTKVEIQKKVLILDKIYNFSKKSPLAYLAIENLAQNLSLKLPPNIIHEKRISFENEYKDLEKNQEFQIYEKNIEHLSHLLETEISSSAKSFRPSDQNLGNISGEEFPEKVWALTYNSGPHQMTGKILTHLKKRNLKATFFHLAERIKKNVEPSKQVISSGMEIGSHSFSQKDLSTAGYLTLEKEISESTELIEKTLGVDIKFYRLPYGAGVKMPFIRQLIAKNDLIHVFWNIDTLDWIPQPPKSIVTRARFLMKKSKNDSGIILFHDIYLRSVLASEQIMNYLKKDGKRVCTLSKIIEDMNAKKKVVCSQKSSSL